jgi:hypothetical protein
LPRLAAQARGPADSHQSFVRTVEGELIHSPRLVARLSYRLSGEGASRAVYVLTVEVETERIASGLKPTLDRTIEMEEGAEPIRQHSILVEAALLAMESEPLEERLRRIEIIAGKDGS